MKEYKTLICKKDDEYPGIFNLTLNRPDKSNAISIGPGQMTEELIDALKEAEQDEEVKVIVIKGNGKNFCGGFDLSMVYRVYGGSPTVKPYQGTRLRVDEDHVVGIRRALFYCKKLLVTQIHGWCIEAGMYFAEASDISVASKDARFAHRGQRLAFGGVVSMPIELVLGHTKKVVELLITGKTIRGDTAEEIGIITRAVEPEILDDEVRNLAAALCQIPSDAVMIGKMGRKTVYESLGLGNFLNQAVFHTLATNLHYRPEERASMFIKDREEGGEKKAFDALHKRFEDALDKTKHFRSER